MLAGTKTQIKMYDAAARPVSLKWSEFDPCVVLRKISHVVEQVPTADFRCKSSSCNDANDRTHTNADSLDSLIFPTAMDRQKVVLGYTSSANCQSSCHVIIPILTKFEMLPVAIPEKALIAYKKAADLVYRQSPLASALEASNRVANCSILLRLYRSLIYPRMHCPIVAPTS